MPLYVPKNQNVFHIGEYMFVYRWWPSIELLAIGFWDFDGSDDDTLEIVVHDPSIMRLKPRRM